MTQNEYDKWYRELNEAQKEATDEFFAWKEKASKGKDCYADIGITRINGNMRHKSTHWKISWSGIKLKVLATQIGKS